ncbi:MULTISPECIES: DUF1376 domain-containing protein [Bartonella]|uniref:Phage related protein n=1 Tax=Bartonella schoenbuchensis (strain DSM 13525 / NCTC 13165 / R1) TaxID=687861 RepID=E6YZ72_BARSR|nr:MULTISPECIES: DUF1376 domain-containing protein [Bartonella]AQX30624.1 Protein of unknown function (DUF1376) [Bartonella schoenbuchensis R1]AQX31148.1 Protein of unknown function (DUF1376) [Bartonella schoenbuchensis R1]CBI82160.1 conserved hypothetical protein [Bartonella schoenbuchensis R1]CBI82754.1 conserved hypothetical protein [Bartonella schoenbuchensis R1]
MSTQKNWVKFYHNQFLKELMGLKPAETAVYAILVFLMIDKGTPILNNASYLSNLCGCSVRTFNKILEALMSYGHIIHLEDDSLWHTSLAFDVNMSRKTSEKASKAATARWNKKREGESYVN